MDELSYNRIFSPNNRNPYTHQGKSVSLSYTSAQFATKKRPRKKEVEIRLAGLVKDSMPCQTKETGIDIISLFGPNVDKHVRIYRPLTKRSGNLCCVESEKEIYEKQIKSRHSQDKRISFIHGDYWSFISWYVEKFKSKRGMYFDYDACKTASSILSELKKANMYNIANECKPRKHVAMSITFTSRNSNRNDAKRLIEYVVSQWKKAGWNVSVIPQGYYDTTPMKTIFFKFSFGDII